MPTTSFNPYEPPKAELPARAKSKSFSRSLSLGEVVVVAWIFSALVALLIPASRGSLGPRRVAADVGRRNRESVLIFLAATVAPALTIVYAVVWASKALRRRRNS